MYIEFLKCIHYERDSCTNNKLSTKRYAFKITFNNNVQNLCSFIEFLSVKEMKSLIKQLVNRFNEKLPQYQINEWSKEYKILLYIIFTCELYKLPEQFCTNSASFPDKIIEEGVILMIKKVIEEYNK